MWVLHLGLGLHFRLLKSPKDYIETNLNMGIAFRETQKKIYLLPFGNISKLSSFTFFKNILNDIILFYICLNPKNSAQNAPYIYFNYCRLFKKLLINLYVINSKLKP